MRGKFSPIHGDGLDFFPIWLLPAGEPRRMGRPSPTSPGDSWRASFGTYLTRMHHNVHLIKNNMSVNVSFLKKDEDLITHY